MSVSFDALTPYCPNPAFIAMAAMNGPWSQPEDSRRHLLTERCAACESRLSQVWSRQSPGEDLLAAAEEIDESSAYGAALRAHAETSATAAPAVAAPPVRRPTAREIVTDYAGRLGAAARTVFYPKGRPFGDVHPAMLSRQPGALPSDAAASAGVRFRRAITLTAVSDERLLVTVDFDQIDEADGGPATLLVLRDDQDQLLIERRIERSSGVERFELPLDTSVLSGDMKAAILLADG